MTTLSLQTHQPTTQQNYRHVVMIVAGLLFVVSAISSLVIQDWRNVTIAMILVVLVFAPILAERWVNLMVPTSLPSPVCTSPADRTLPGWLLALV
jgi:hypothetical protein